MSKRFLSYIACLLLPLSLIGCIEEDGFKNTPAGNFEALWNLMDEHYCFFPQAAEEFGLDWNAVYHKYKPLVNECNDDAELFDVLGDMIAELRDGHVNLSSEYGTKFYWNWQLDYPLNFSDSIQRNYLGRDFRVTGGIRYTELPDSIGYVYVGTFSNQFGTGNLSQMLLNLKNTKGLVLDIRNNGGGILTAAERLASSFAKERIHCGYIQHKTGKGHYDFSSPEKLYLEAGRGTVWLRPVVLLTNRGVYSAANHFVMLMRELPNVVVLGDKTGGGSGMPLNSTLPNGWAVRFSACPILDAQGRHTEFGIEPDVKVNMSSEDWNNGRDTMIEKAKELIFEYYNKISERQ
ncbi:MAG: S41 family peptidase [Bacteroidaceae bacterium]|nr:S41 family peptidase [Bacteroidaceae bacterium]